VGVLNLALLDWSCRSAFVFGLEDTCTLKGLFSDEWLSIRAFCNIIENMGHGYFKVPIRSRQKLRLRGTSIVF